MADNAYLKELETLLTALADRTRLRLLNLMADDEICVARFTEMLGDSQPKISRHLAYLRNAGLVEARRDGKWMHYSIKWPHDDGLRSVLRAAVAAASDRFATEPEPAIFPMARTGRPAAFISAEAYTSEPEPAPARSYHNELDEFLL